MDQAPVFTGNDPLDPSRLSLNNGIHQGDFFIGPPIDGVNPTTVRNLVEYLAKRDSSDEFMILKVLSTSSDGDSSEDRQGKVLLHNERLILSLLNDQPGVIHHHGLFRDRNHFILVLDCLVAHKYDTNGRYKDYINLQHYVIKKKKLNEREALEMFHNILMTLQVLHAKNIVHRDLKLGNMVLNLRSNRITLTNFGLSKHLVRDSEMLTDRRGSLAYVSPDVLSGNPYDGKASDMWAMGVLLYTMLYGQFPFYNEDPQELFKKIKAADFSIPSTGDMKTQETSLLIRQLIEKNPGRRLTAAQALHLVRSRLSHLVTRSIVEHAPQVVPDSTEPVGMDDCTVPEQQDDSYLSSPLEEMHSTSNLHLNTVQLTMSPLLVAEPYSGQLGTTNVAAVHMLSPLVASPVNVSPSSPGTEPLLPYVLTSVPSHIQRSSRSTSSENPFAQLYSSLPISNAPDMRSGYAPSNSLSNTSMSETHPLSGIPSATSSFPPAIVYHRYPLTLSLSTDSYFSTSPENTTEDRPVHHAVSHSTPVGTSLYLSPNISPRRTFQDSIVNSQTNDSLVTVRTSHNSQIGASVRICSSRPGHSQGHGRHSFSEGDRPNPHLLIPPQTHSQTQRRRRNSSGCEQNIHQPATSMTGRSSCLSRHRRRSHDARAEQGELLACLNAAASRRRRSHSSPFQVPVQVHYSAPTTQSSRTNP